MKVKSEGGGGEAVETRVRLMDAAEELIARNGINGASLREITEKAGVNLALVKYHFGSKDGLVEAMMLRRIGPLDQRRLELLDAVEARVPKGPLPLEEVLEALIRPPVEAGLAKSREAKQLMRLIGRVFAEPPVVMRLMMKHLAPMMRRFDAAFARAMPEFAGRDHDWRKIACMGVVQHSLLMLSMIDEAPLPIRVLKGPAPKPEIVLRRLVAFCAAGMRAQVEEGK